MFSVLQAAESRCIHTIDLSGSEGHSDDGKEAAGECNEMDWFGMERNEMDWFGVSFYNVWRY